MELRISKGKQGRSKVDENNAPRLDPSQKDHRVSQWL